MKGFELKGMRMDEVLNITDSKLSVRNHVTTRARIKQDIRMRHLIDKYYTIRMSGGKIKKEGLVKSLGYVVSVITVGIIHFCVSQTCLCYAWRSSSRDQKRVTCWNQTCSWHRYRCCGGMAGDRASQDIFME